MNLKLDSKTSSSIPYTLYHGTFIHTPQLGNRVIISNGLIGVNHQGIIDFIDDDFNHHQNHCINHFQQNYPAFDSVKSNFRFIDTSNNPTQFYFPGFIDTHIHSSQYPNIGIGLNIQLLDWLNTFTFPLEKSFNEKNITTAIDIYTKIINKTLANGTTCASYFTTIDTITTKIFGKLMMDLGQRGFVGKVCMNHNSEDEEYEECEGETMESMKELIRYFKLLNEEVGGGSRHDDDDGNDHDNPLIKPIITPRFAPVCTRLLLKKLGALAVEENLPIQTHISENKNEINLVKKLFPECNNYASVYDDHDLLQSSTILAHGVHLTDEECSLIREKNCSISHCPTSNTFISSGEAPVRNYLYEKKINVALGTDVSGGFDASILGIIRHAILVSNHLSMKSGKVSDKLTLNEALYMATQGGAEAVGLPNKIGSFEIGKKFDCQLIDLGSMNSNIDLFDWQIPEKSDPVEELQFKLDNLLNKWVFCGDDRNCQKVYVNGRVVVDKRRY